MEALFSSYPYSTEQWILLAFYAFLIGIHKAGFKGPAMLAIPLSAVILGGRYSAAVVAPLLLLGDILAITVYHKEVKWKQLVKLFPWALVGVAVGTLIGNSVSDLIFKRIMGAVLLGCILTMIIQPIISRKKIDFSKHRIFYTGATGIAAGVATMIGNAASGIINIYFLALQLPKNFFIGSVAYFFFIINSIKIPLHLFVWKTIDTASIRLDAILAVPVVIGFTVGFFIVKRLPESGFKKLIFIATAAAAVRLFF